MWNLLEKYIKSVLKWREKYFSQDSYPDNDTIFFIKSV